MGQPCNDTTGKTWTTCRKSSPILCLFKTNPTYTGLRLNTGVRVPRPTANCQSRYTEHFVPWDCNKKRKDDVAASLLRIVKMHDTCLESAKPVSICTDICQTERLKNDSCNKPQTNPRYLIEWTKKKARGTSPHSPPNHYNPVYLPSFLFWLFFYQLSTLEDEGTTFKQRVI